MSVTSTTTSVATRSASDAWRAVVTPLGLFALAAFVRLAAMIAVPFPLSEGSAYYVAVARNMAEGRGTVIDALWSYATPPLAIPRQAFELWQPMASVIAAWPMKLLGPSFTSAQLGFVLFGALLAPLAWWLARDATQRLSVPANRAGAVAAGAGALVAVGAPFVLATAVPDSTLPFTVFAVAACVAMPAAAKGKRLGVVATGLLLGLAYLTRMEAVYLGLVFVLLAWQAGVRGRNLFGRIGAVAVIGGLVALPWWLRNLAAFGTPLPGQLADNAFMTRNEQIFAWTDQPSLSGFLAQGPATIVTNIAAAAWHNFADVMLLPGTAIVVAGLLAIALGWRRRGAFRGSAMWALLIYGVIAFVVTTVAFPVATLWGTFSHASGPLLVALAVLAVVGGDAFVARVRAYRGWQRANAWMAPGALVALALTMTVLQVTFASAQSTARARQIDAAAAIVSRELSPDPTVPIITDHPIWLSDATGVPALALPDESATSVVDLARTFGAGTIVLVDSDLPNAAQLRADSTGCLQPQPVPALTDVPEMTVFTIAEACL